MTETFYDETLRLLVAEGWLRRDDSVLVVAGGPSDREALLASGITSATITNVDGGRATNGEYAPYAWSRQDAEALAFPDASFDVSIVHQGLHHCRSPHRALLEMYRVARRGLVVFEPHDTFLTRIGVRMGVGQQYEVAAVAANDLQRVAVCRTQRYPTTSTDGPHARPVRRWLRTTRPGFPGSAASTTCECPARWPTECGRGRRALPPAWRSPSHVPSYG